MKVHLFKIFRMRWTYALRLQLPWSTQPGTQETNLSQSNHWAASHQPLSAPHLHPGRGHGRGVPGPLGASIILVHTYVHECTWAYIHMYACVNLYLCMHAACVHVWTCTHIISVHLMHWMNYHAIYTFLYTCYCAPGVQAAKVTWQLTHPPVYYMAL